MLDFFFLTQYGYPRTVSNKYVNSFPGGYGGEATPVPIPNTVVKLSCADGTWDASPWESRSLPGISLILDSSMVEYVAVNHGVVGSSPTRGAINFIS